MKKLTKEQKLKQQIKELSLELRKASDDADTYMEFYNEISSMFDCGDIWDRNNKKTLLTKVSEYREHAEAYRKQNEGIIKAETLRADEFHQIIDALINPDILTEKYKQQQHSQKY